MIKNKIKKIISFNSFINNKYLLYKLKFYKKNFTNQKNFFYKILINIEIIKKNLIIIKKIFNNLNICGSGGDYISLPNISTSDCIIFYFIKKNLIKNSGNSFFLKSGSIDYLNKFKILNNYFLNNNFNIFNYIKNYYNYNFNFRNKIKLNNNFNIFNPILNIIINIKNIIGIYSLKILFFYKLLNINNLILFNNNSDDIIQNKEIFFFKNKLFFINNNQYNLHNFFFNKIIFFENLKFQLFNLKLKNNFFIYSKIILLKKFFLIKKKLKFYFYLLINNYFYKFFKKIIKKKNE
ncbi:hypothetical protein [Candidatus Carsonella ruddii]|uniref:Isoleucyl-tRNA synthetase n=1 Tax=Carsonella ruddii TaxID=114186 RepID=A0A1U9RSK4_CARRU|nr:hypothetical protein [Candidatus Carsonella ruddii]AQU89465.1 Isoleucyl-tRNA synthetase [Candidatus Carsonella ruddii]